MRPIRSVLRRVIPLLIAAPLLAGGCASVDSIEAPACGPDGEARAVATMYFGRNIGDHLGVSEADWSAFVDAEVTSRFGDGTMSDADGQWRDVDTGAIVREPSKVLTLILYHEDDDRLAIQAIADAYKAQFQQQAVAVIIERECVSFR